MSKKIIRQFCILLLLILINTGCSVHPNNTDINKPTEQGNTNGNIKQMGFAVEKDGYIYYWNGTGNGLHKKRTDGSEKQKLVTGHTLEINIVGDFIYYIGGGYPGYISKVNKNGGAAEILEGKRRSSNLIVLGDIIFYRREYKDLRSMDINGKNKKKLKSDILEFSIYEDSIYFTDQSDKCLYKMDLTGKNVQKLSNDYAADINIENGWIYFWNFNDKKIYKLKIDGTGRIALCSDKCSNLNLYKGVLYFRKESSLWKMKIDGTGKNKVLKGNIVDINIVNDFIVYREVTGDSGIYKINFDGSGKELWR